MKGVLSGIRFRWWVLLGSALLLLWLTVAGRNLRRQLDLTRRARASASELETRIRDTRAQRESLAESLSGTSVDPAALVEGGGWTVGETAETVYADGIRHRSVDMAFQDVTWERVRDLMTRAEGGTPPWRVTALRIDTTVGGLEGRLRLEALDRVSEPGERSD